MTAIDPNTPDKPVVVPASAASDQAGTAARDILLLVSALPALVAVLGTHDVTKIVAYLGSADFAPVLGIAVTAGTLAWRQWIARKRHTNDVKVASAAPDTVAVVKGN